MDEPNPNTAFHQRKNRLPGFDYGNTDHDYFLTLCAHDRSKPFADPSLAREVVETLLYQSKTGRARIYAYVLMPDHLHCVLSPRAGADVSSIVRDFKAFSTRLAWRHGVTGNLWQRGFHDHIVRREESLLRICEYVLANPVRKGLVGIDKEWPFAGMHDPLPV